MKIKSKYTRSIINQIRIKCINGSKQKFVILAILTFTVIIMIKSRYNLSIAAYDESNNEINKESTLLTAKYVFEYCKDASYYNHIEIGQSTTKSFCDCNKMDNYTNNNNGYIFLLRLSKCGTTSFSSLFKCLGYNVSHAVNQVAKEMDYSFDNNKSLLSGDEIKKYNAFTQLDVCSSRNNPNIKCIFPQFKYYKLLNEQYGNSSYFILNIRNMSKHIYSIWHYHSTGSRIVRSKEFDYLPNINWDTNNITDKLNKIKIWETWLLKHYYNVCKYFKNNKQFMVFDIDESYTDLTKLEYMLDTPCQFTSFPRLNSRFSVYKFT